MPLFGNQLPPTPPPSLTPPPNKGFGQKQDLLVPKQPDIQGANKFPSVSNQPTQNPTSQNNTQPSILGLRQILETGANAKRELGIKDSNTLKEEKTKDFSIFGNKKEISRKEFKNELKNDPTIFKLQKQAGLHLNRAERGNLVKKALPKIYGSNISKGDLKRGIHHLYKEKLATTDIKEKGILRKEINFLKKLGR